MKQPTGPKPDTYDWAWEQTKAERERERSKQGEPEEWLQPVDLVVLRAGTAACSRAGISFIAMPNAATIPDPLVNIASGEAWADAEGG